VGVLLAMPAIFVSVAEIGVDSGLDFKGAQEPANVSNIKKHDIYNFAIVPRVIGLSIEPNLPKRSFNLFINDISNKLGWQLG
jgi:hypothetical protein